MSGSCSFLGGDKNEFALEVVFRPDPDGGKAATSEESASWGSFALWVGGKNLCEHIEDEDVVAHVHWYLLPLLEWFAEKWDYLFHEQRLPNANKGPDSQSSLQRTQVPPAVLEENRACEWECRQYDWWERHCLLACREGGLFPDVFFRRWEDRIEISWGRAVLPGSPESYRFTNDEGFVRLLPENVAVPAYDVLSKAAAHLKSQMPDSERFHLLFDAVQHIKKVPKESDSTE
jgi:hypothetical protein